MSNPALPAHPPILALGYSEAAMMLRTPAAQKVEALISIHGLREHAVDAPWVAHQLVLRFDDVETANLSDPARAYAAWTRQKWAKEMGRPLTPPSAEDAKAIIEFARGITQLEGAVLCQCQAGVSRSPAAALLCLATWTGEGQEEYCVRHLLRARPCAAPLLDLISFGDDLLKRGGKLVDAVRRAR